MVNKIRENKIVLVVVLAAAPRAAVALVGYTIHGPFIGQLYPGTDEASYYNPAMSLVGSGKFFRDTSTPEIFRPPGYSLLMIPGIILSRVHFVTILLQLFSSCLTVLAVYSIGKTLSESTKVGLAGAMAFAVDPMSIAFTSFLMSETLFTFAVSIFLFLLVRYCRGHTVSLFLASLAGAGAVYVRPVGYYLTMGHLPDIVNLGSRLVF